MRQQDKVIIWPAYFDSTKTRKNGRRVPKDLTVLSPKILEIREAAEKLHLSCEVIADATYSKTPWLKTGMLLIEKNDSKEEIIRNIAKQLLKLRSNTAVSK